MSVIVFVNELKSFKLKKKVLLDEFWAKIFSISTNKDSFVSIEVENFINNLWFWFFCNWKKNRLFLSVALR